MQFSRLHRLAWSERSLCSLKGILRARWLLIVAVLGAFGSIPKVGAQDVRIESVGWDNAGQPRVRVSAREGSYFVLLRGSTLSDLSHPVALRAGAAGASSVELSDASPIRDRAFYRVARWALGSAGDQDRDGMDDAYEVGRVPFLNPLDAADAFADADGDLRSNLMEVRAGTDPLRADFFVVTSPRNGETGVSVNRETEFRFTVALAPGTVVGGSNVWAEASGRRLLTRADLSGDRRTLTLFYLEPVPANARVRVSLDGTGWTDASGRDLDLDRDGQPGGVVALEYATAGVAPVAGTGLVGRVFASEPAQDGASPGSFTNRPLAGVTVTVDGAEETLRAVTDGEGRFELNPSPAGRFFVHVDGRTVVDVAAGVRWPDLAYYPFVGKAWEATAGVTNNLAGGTGEIFLPRIGGGTLRAVSATTPTTVGFPAEVLASNPALAGVQIEVPPNALFADDGTRGGRVGMAPVSPDRLPEPLPPGLSFPLVITVQTDGPQNFDQPVPVSFPNLPDPVTGRVLKPGEKSALWSFDHDLGIWEIVGPMTVSADGRLLVSDAGVGIRQPGWHGSNPGTGGGGPGPKPPKASPRPPRPPRPPLSPPSPPPPPPPPPPAPPGSGPGGGGGGDGDGDGPSIPDFPDLPDLPFIDEPESWGELVSDVVDQLPTLGPDIFGPAVDIGKEGIEMFEDLGEVIGSSQVADSDGDGVPDVVESRDEFLNEIKEQAEDALPGLPEDTDEAASTLREWWNIWQELYGGSSRSLQRGGAAGPGVGGMAVGGTTPPLAALPHLAELQAESADLERVAELETAFDGYFEVLLGSNAWRTLKDGRVPLQEWLPVVTAATAAQRAGSEGGAVITAAETAALGAAGSLGFSFNTNLVMRLNQTLSENLRGRVLRSQGPAGSPDIVDAAEEREAVGRIVDLANGEADAGFERIADRAIELAERMGPALGGFFAAYVPAEAEESSADNQFPVLLEIYPAGGQRQEQRLKTDALGKLNGLRLPARAVVVVRWLDPASMQEAVAFFRTGEAGSSFTIPQAFWDENTPTSDRDADGLPDGAERIVGTDVAKADSDGDGVVDGAEVRSGTNPLDGIVLQPGIVANGETPGQAKDVVVETYDLSAFGGASSVTRLLVADGAAGVSVMEWDGVQLTHLGQLDTPGDARRVALPGSGTLIADEVGLGAFADGAGGLGILDWSDPVRPRLVHQVVPRGNTLSVTIHAGVVYAGTDAGVLMAVDLFTGARLDELELGYPVHDLRVHQEILWVTGPRSGKAALQSIALEADGFLGTPGVVAVNGDVSTAVRGLRLTVGDGVAFTIHGRGYSTWFITNLVVALPAGTGATAQFGWFDLAPDGSGLGVACVGANASDDGRHDVSIYDLSDPFRTDRFIQTIETPGVASAVVLHDGLAFVADGTAGVQVLRYRALDRGTQPPRVTLAVSPGGQVVAGSRLAAGVTALDDAAARNVQLYVDGVLVAAEAGWPFDFAVRAPTLDATGAARRVGLQAAPGPRTLVVQARAEDTAGNFGWSAPLTVSVIPDTFAPTVTRWEPEAGRVVAGDSLIFLGFSEAMDVASLTSGTIQVLAAGTDGLWETADDVSLAGGTLSFLERGNRVFLRFPAGMAHGDYRLRVSGSVRDASGNQMGAAVVSDFRVRDVDLRGGGVMEESGRLPSVGDRDVYSFTAAEGQALFFDLLAGAGVGMRWTLNGPTGARVFSEAAFFDVGTRVMPVAGKYTLTWERTGGNQQDYQFKIWSIPAAEAFDVVIGDIVTSGQPSAGAGRIETPGATDVYAFTAQAGQTVFFDLQEGGTARIRWQLRDAEGVTVFREGMFFDVGAVTLVRGGRYTLTVGTEESDYVGSYAFQLWNVAGTQAFDISIGNTISEGVPGGGAGRIEAPGVQDVYRFQAVAGQVVFFDLLEGATARIRWRLTDSEGNEVFSEGFFFDPGSVTLSRGGNYTLTVGTSNSDHQGTYSFRLINVPAAQVFPIQVGDTVTPGSPSAGAGNLETPGAMDVYTFEAAAGQVVFFDLLSGGTGRMNWELTDADGNRVFREGFFFDPGSVTLVRGGRYTLSIGNPDSDYVGEYGFRIVVVPAAGEFRLSVGDTVSDGVPAAGAGRIESPGVLDRYQITVATNQRVVFDLLSGGTGSWTWQLVDDTGAQVFREGFFFDPAAVQLLAGRTYTLTVGAANSDVTGAYSFRLIVSP
jgi:predicted secreted protein